MNEMKRDMIRIQELVGSAFGQTGALVALSDGGHMNPKKLQKTLEQTMEHFESAALELRRLCEQYSPGTGGFSKKKRGRFYVPASPNPHSYQRKRCSAFFYSPNGRGKCQPDAEAG